jgi:hypothetical protein
MRKIGLKHKFQYKFDNFMAKGFVALISALGMISLILIIVAALAAVTTGWGPPDDTEFTFIEAFWASLMRTLDPGTMGDDQG